MLDWLWERLGGKKKGREASGAAAAPAREPTDTTPEAVTPDEAPAARIPPEHAAFLLSLVEAEEGAELQDLPADDRLFVSAVMKLFHEKRLEVPVLPETALQISRLLSDPMSTGADFVAVLELDPSLSAHVLRVANSVYYGAAGRTDNLRDALFRIGLNHLRAIAVVSHLEGKVLQGGMFPREAGWLAEFSVALARLAHALAPSLGLKPDAAFTLGMLLHIEHFIIMGIPAPVAAGRRERIRPSVRALGLVVSRYGPAIRELAARDWDMTELLLQHGDEQESGVVRGYRQLQRSLIAAWTGEGLPREVDGVAPERLEAALGEVPPP